MRIRIIFIFAIGWLAHSCLITEVGNPNSAKTSDPYENCVIESKEPIDWTEDSEMGVSPQEFFAQSAGTCQAPFAWQVRGWHDFVQVDPPSGQSIIEVTIEIDEDSAVFVKREPDPSLSGPDRPAICPSSLEATASVSLVTSDGEFNETRSVTITNEDGADKPRIRFDINTEELAGTITFRTSQESIIGTLSVEVTSIQNQCSGYMDFSLKGVDLGENTALASMIFASWPASDSNTY